MIRLAKISDAEQINYINVSGWKETYKDIFPKDFLDNLNGYDEENVQKIRDKIDQYVVCELEGKVVAMARYGKNKKGYDDNYAEVYALYVDSNYKNKKIGTQMVNFIFEQLKDNYKYVLISTLKENSANEFYKKIGGEFIGNCDFKLNDNTYIENIYKYYL